MINALGYSSLNAGLGKACRDNIQALATLAPVAQYPFPIGRNVDGQIWPEMPFDVNYCHFHPLKAVADCLDANGQRLSTQINVAYWVSEGSHLDPAWAKSARHFDAIWTASQFFADVIGRSIATETQVIPHIVETTPYFDERLDDDRFVFGLDFDARSRVMRKRPDAAITSFRRAFGDRDDVRLIVKTRHCPPAERKRLIELGGPNVEYHWDQLPPSKLARILRRIDCYVSLHASEAFGYNLAEAMLAGLPVIATHYSGNLEYMDASNSMLVDFKMVKIPDRFFPFGYWADPDIDHTVELMRWVFDAQDSNELRSIRANARRSIEMNHSQAMIAQKMKAALGL